MPCPLIGKQNAFEIRMAAKSDDEEVEDFALSQLAGGTDRDQSGG